jgi:hypothetical protein
MAVVLMLVVSLLLQAGVLQADSSKMAVGLTCGRLSSSGKSLNNQGLPISNLTSFAEQPLPSVCEAVALLLQQPEAHCDLTILLDNPSMPTLPLQSHVLPVASVDQVQRKFDLVLEVGWFKCSRSISC